MDFLRSGWGKAAVGAGLATALAVYFLMDFSPDTGSSARLLMSLFLGAFAGFGVWSFAGIPALIADLIGLARGRRAAASAQPIHAPDERPQLAPARKGLVRRVVTLLGDEGVFAPEVPDPAMLFEGVADWDGPVTQAAVLGALDEANYWHPDFDPERCMANVVMHNSHAEQFEETLRRQIADLERLAGGALDVRDVAIDLTLLDGPGPHPPCTIGMTVNGDPVTLTYAPAGKYLSTYIHVALARALKAANCGKRLAWLWCDQGAWIACLPDGAVERLNAGPGFDKAGFDGWDWIDVGDPIAAGAAV